MPEPFVQRTLRVPLDLDQWLEAEAQKRKITVTLLIITALRKEQGK